LLKRKLKVIFTLIFVIACTLVAIGRYSYLRALDAADEIVRLVDEYFELDDSTLLFTSGPDDDRMQLAFEFKYWNGTGWDAHFYIYVSPFGNVVATNSTDLPKRIDAMVSGESDLNRP
jgi:hypothetical protein